MADSLPTLSPAELARYSRHVLLGEIGVEGQRKISGARVLVIGAGGLGSPAALYLAAAGVGTLGMADFDRVAAHNLQRQLLHDDTTLDQPKVTSAARRLRATNPHIRVVEHPEGITVENALKIFSEYDVIVDGTDNFSARYLNNDAAFLARKPLVYGSVFKFDGQVAIFAPSRGGPCYRCLFPTPPPPGAVPGCGEAGVLGALCGVIGSLQALETLKLITGVGKPLLGRLLTYDALAHRFSTLTLAREPHCPLCGSAPTLRALDEKNYSSACAPEPSRPMKLDDLPLEISVADAKRLMDRAAEPAVLIDVREPYELEICAIAGARHIPMRQIPENVGTLPKQAQFLLLCHHGGRSRRVTEYLRSQGFAGATNVGGGIDAWATEIDPSLRRY